MRSNKVGKHWIKLSDCITLVEDLSGSLIILTRSCDSPIDGKYDLFQIFVHRTHFKLHFF